MKLSIEWTDDCQGKKDYDGDIVSISTRFWPKNYQANGLYSATCNVMLSDGYKHHNGKNEYLISQDFEGETFDQVASQVEQWAQIQANKVYSILKFEFKKNINSK